MLKNVSNNVSDEGYDSDDCPAPWQDVDFFMDEVLASAEDALSTEKLVVGAPIVEERTVVQTKLSPREMDNMTVDELKKELKKRNLSTNGKKKGLRERLGIAVDQGVEVVDLDSSEVRKEAVKSTDFSEGCYWETINADGDVIEDDVRPPHLHEPTAPEGEPKSSTNLKRNFTVEFDRAVFTGKAFIPKKRHGKFIKKNGKIQWALAPCNDTVPKLDFLQRNKLDEHSHPVDWFESFVPVRNKDRSDPKRRKFSIENMLSWSNTKAAMENAGLGGRYKDFCSFTMDEFKQHIGIYLFNYLFIYFLFYKMYITNIL